MVNHIRNLIQRREGQNIVEFALLAPLLFMVLFGISEFGNAWLQSNTATSAAREAARIAAVTNPFSTAGAEARARQVLAAAGITAATVNVSAPDPATRQVTVTVQFTYNSLTGGFIPGVNGMILRGQTTMRYE